MDTKQALDILNLTADASLEDAKISFRTLAKKYHPDKLIINGENFIDHEKMKDINLAFHNLKNILKPKKVSVPSEDIASLKKSKQKKPQKTTETKRNYFSVNFTSLFKTIHKNFFTAPKSKKRYRKSKPSATFKSAGGSKSRATDKPNNYVKKKKTFDSVLHKTIKSSLKNNVDKSDNFIFKQRVKPQNTYFKYMELRQQMCSKRKRINQKGFTPIEKISPISKIKKL